MNEKIKVDWYEWEKMGRSYVVFFGPLSCSVSWRGSDARGDKRWWVSDVFGNRHMSRQSYDNLDDAILEAETLLSAALIDAAHAKHEAQAFGERARK